MYLVFSHLVLLTLSFSYLMFLRFYAASAAVGVTNEDLANANNVGVVDLCMRDSRRGLRFRVRLSPRGLFFISVSAANVNNSHFLMRRWSMATDLSVTVPRPAAASIKSLFIVPGLTVFMLLRIYMG